MPHSAGCTALLLARKPSSSAILVTQPKGPMSSGDFVLCHSCEVTDFSAEVCICVLHSLGAERLEEEEVVLRSKDLLGGSGFAAASGKLRLFCSLS